MKRLLIGLLVAALSSAGSGAAVAQKDVLANDADLFLPVTSDKDLGRQTRDQWLAMSQHNARFYWEAWNCADKPCDDATKKKIRSIAKLVHRTKENWGLFFSPKE
jgi:hypothetical protein